MAKINKIQLSGNVYDIEDVNATKTIELTQAEYDALAEIDPNAFYVISDAEGVDLSNYYTKTEVDNEIYAAVSGKQETLISGTNIKTINNTSILGSGNIDIQGGSVTVDSELSTTSENPVQNKVITNALSDKAQMIELTQAEYNALVDKDPDTLYAITDAPTIDMSNYYSKDETDDLLDEKQETLVSGTNIKTINNTSILGSGNINIQGGGSSYTAGDGIDITNDVISVTGKADTSTVTSLNNIVTAHTANTSVHIQSGGKVIYNLTNVSGAAGGTNLSASWSGNCSGITELTDGMNIQIKIPVSGHASGVTISINGGEKHKCILNASTNLTTQYPKDAIIRLVYDANQSGTFYTGSTTTVTTQGVWKVSDYDSNTNTIGYSLGYNQVTFKVDAPTYRYVMLFTKDETTLTPVNSVTSTAGTKTLTTEEFDPFGGIYCKNDKSTVNAGSTLAASTVWTQLALDLRYSFNTTDTLIPQQAVYMVVVPQSNGKVKLHTDPISQTLPTTEDGLVYIYLGQAYSTTNLYLAAEHPLYQFKNGKLMSYTADDNTVDSELSDSSENPVQNKVITNAVTQVNNALTAHTANTSVHVTVANKNAWNAKLDADDVKNFFGAVNYDSQTKRINFYNTSTGGTVLAYVDATDFIKDGMVSNVEIKTITSGGSQVEVIAITFNADAGKEEIDIPLTDVFDPNNYYTKSEVNNLIPTVPTSNTAFTNDAQYATSGYVNSAVSGKADTSAFTAHTANTTIHTTSAEKTSWNGAVTDVATVSASTAANTTALGGLKLVKLTQAEYDALATKDSSTVYFING